jgi:hypothetical protein
MGEIEKER